MKASRLISLESLRSIGVDPRHYQIIVLSTLLILGVFWLDFRVNLGSIGLVFLSAISTQVICEKLLLARQLKQVDMRSPIITSLSLCLLLRADISSLLTMWPLAVAAIIAIVSKFLLRSNGKHLFNPANIGIVAMLIITPAAWTTPGQWGPLLWAALAMAGAGFFVTYRAARADVPIFFLGSYAALLFGRALWLGDPLTIPVLNLQNGAILLFAFFMISDPKTTPDALGGRAAFCIGTALIAYALQYHFFVTDGLFYALAIACIIRPLIERLQSAQAYQWPKPIFRTIIPQGEHYASSIGTPSKKS